MTAAATPNRSAAGTPGVASVLRLSPQAVLAVYLLALALPQNNVLAGGGGAITPARLVAGGCLVWWLAARFFCRSGMDTSPNPMRRVLLLALVLFAAADTLAFLGGVDDFRIAAADRAAMLLVLSLGAALLICDTIRDPRALRILFGAAVIGFSASALAAVLQFVVGLNLRPLTVFPGLTAQTVNIQDLLRGGLARASGFANHPIELAATSVVALPLAIYLARHTKYTVFWWACAAVLVGGPLVSISRTGLLGLVVVALFLLPRFGLVRWLLSVGLLGSVVLLAGAIEPKLIDVLVSTVAGSSKDSSIWSRLTKYDYVWTHFLDKPLGGQGFGTYITPVQPFLDNQYLLTTVESGAFGVIALLGLLFVPLRWMFKVWLGKKSTTPEPLRDAAWALVVALLVSAISFGTYDGLAFPQFAGMSVVLTAMAGAVYAMVRQQEVTP
ncbi:hypothetical protein GCM10010174_87440 [Kutzneria viridogrisea]|uniref:O-antigen ligase n=1 Tax=Kutzneria viridogrisea TaxID=47990 RepID=A0ABR6BY22_9PSEU|nr:O-antigen ligase [Kutzneria viridogrisea]